MTRIQAKKILDAHHNSIDSQGEEVVQERVNGMQIYSVPVNLNDLIALPEEAEPEVNYKASFRARKDVARFSDSVMVLDAEGHALAMFVKRVNDTNQNMLLSKKIVDMANTFRPPPSKYDARRINVGEKVFL